MYVFKQASVNFDTGWVWFHISVVFNSIHFKPKKGTPTMVTSITCQVSTRDFKWFTVTYLLPNFM